MQRICNQLVERNFKVYLICRQSGGLSEELFDRHIRFFQLSSSSLMVKTREIRKIIKTIRPDYVHVQGLFKDAFIPGLHFNRSYKFFITIWGSDLNLFSKNYLNRLFQNIALWSCDRLHLLSDHISRQVKRTYLGVNLKKTVVFSWGIDFLSFQKPDPDTMQKICEELQISCSDPIVLSYRNHKPLYNHHTIVASMASVKASVPNVRYIFSRGNADESYLKETFNLVRRYNLTENFRFIDRWLGDKEICALVNLAKVCVSIPFYDGQPATLFEIMATKAVPVISSLENFKPFFINGVNGFYLNNVNDSEELARITIEVLNNYAVIAPPIYTTNNKYVEKNFNWSNNSKLQIGLYE